MNLKILMITLVLLFSVQTNGFAISMEKYFVFIGEKVMVKRIFRRDEEVRLDNEFLAKYKVIKVVRGNYPAKEIIFTAYDHYGLPAFLSYKRVLLYVEKYEGKFYHSKYQFSPLFQTKNGDWAGPYSSYDYNHKNNKNTLINPERIEFKNSVEFDISRYNKKSTAKWFPKPYFKITGKKAIAVYGNYVEELFLLKQSGVLKARGTFQDF